MEEGEAEGEGEGRRVDHDAGFSAGQRLVGSEQGAGPARGRIARPSLIGDPGQIVRTGRLERGDAADPPCDVAVDASADGRRDLVEPESPGPIARTPGPAGAPLRDS